MPLTTYTAGDVLTALSLNDNFAVAASGQKAVFNETQANNTAGGAFNSGSFIKRTLNTTVVNTITGCTLTSSVVALPAGTYSVTAFAPAHKSDLHKLRLQNTSDTTTIAIGQNNIAATSDDVGNTAILQTVFTLAATKNIELQHRCSNTQFTNGFGVQCNFSTDEIYATIEIVQIA